MVPPLAPSALSRPISLRRCATDTSITFITRMPATARLIAAMPATPSVSVPSSLSKVASIASCVMTVTSCSPSWRCWMISRHLALGRLDGVAVARLDQDAEQRVGVEHRLRQRHRHDGQLVGVHAQPAAVVRRVRR